MHPTFAIVSPTGERIELATSAFDPSPFALDDDTEGLGFVDREVQIAPSTADGGRFRATRAASRPFTLVVDVWGLTIEERSANLLTLGRVIRRVEGRPLPRLEATLPSGDVFELPFIHEGGGEAIKRVLMGGPVVVPLALVAPDPYWTARDATPFTVRGLQSTGTFLPGLAEMRLTSSAAAGTLVVDNAGETHAFPTWSLTGPTTLATISLGDAIWAIGPIAATETIVVDTKARTAQLEDGTNVYNRLRPAPRLFTIPPGRHTIGVVLANASPASVATCYFRPRMEVIL